MNSHTLKQLSRSIRTYSHETQRRRLDSLMTSIANHPHREELELLIQKQVTDDRRFRTIPSY